MTLGFASWAQAASVTVYTDRSNWESAVGGLFSEEDFNDSTLNSDLSVTTDAGRIRNNRWEDRVKTSSLGTHTTTWSFDNSIMGYGADWDIAGPQGAGGGIQVTLDSFAVADEISKDMGNFE